MKGEKGFGDEWEADVGGPPRGRSVAVGKERIGRANARFSRLGLAARLLCMYLPRSFPQSSRQDRVVTGARPRKLGIPCSNSRVPSLCSGAAVRPDRLSLPIKYLGI